MAMGGAKIWILPLSPPPNPSGHPPVEDRKAASPSLSNQAQIALPSIPSCLSLRSQALLTCLNVASTRLAGNMFLGREERQELRIPVLAQEAFG